ncbi:hypothetical protein M5689_019077 [Euphorbia peplus]|nr:hypothetical protein M5689_019077 [Euphorbia peplus]
MLYSKNNYDSRTVKLAFYFEATTISIGRLFCNDNQQKPRPISRKCRTVFSTTSIQPWTVICNDIKSYKKQGLKILISDQESLDKKHVVNIVYIKVLQG